MSKIIQAAFSSGKFATTTDVFQWDKGDILQIEGLDLPESYEVHFSNSLSTPALVVSASGNTVETPAEVFENSGREVYAWIVVLESANVYHTIGQVRIPINPRGMPEDLIPTPGNVPDRSKSAIKQAVDQWLAEHRPEFSDGVPYAVKDALITLFEHVAYTDDQGETYLNNLRRAFAMVKSLVSIEAVLDTGGAEITDSDTLGTLRQYLTVTASYDDGSTAIITDYTLSGTLEVGVSTIVVTYGTATDTVDVTVTGQTTLVSIGAVFDNGGATIYDTDGITLEDLRQYLTVTAYYDDSSSREVINYTLSGELDVGQNTITASYGGKTTTFSVTVTSYFNVWTWDYEDADRLLMVRVKRPATTAVLANSAFRPALGQENTSRCSFVLKHGLDGSELVFEDNTPITIDGENVYPIPIPANATHLSASLTPSAEYFAISRWVYNGNSEWTREINGSWTQGSISQDFESGENKYITINCKPASASGTNYNNTTLPYPSVRVEFS